MTALGQHKGVTFSIPPNDDGVWHYRIHPTRSRRTAALGQPKPPPVEGYLTRDEAIAAAKQAIDFWLAGERARTS
jgi:hypothetical protein